MKKQRYIVEIEMPDGDFISAGWLKDLIQTDCDVEDEGRKKVTVQETSLPSNLDEAAEEYEENKVHSISALGTDKDGFAYYMRTGTSFSDAFKAGAEWMAGQGVTSEGEILDVSGRPLADRVIRTVSIKDMEQCLKDFNKGDKVVVQIRKK